MTNRAAAVRLFYRLLLHSSDAIMKRNGFGVFELISGQNEGLIGVDSTASPITAGLTAALNRCRLISDEVRANTLPHILC